MPSDFELKVRLSHELPKDSDGSSAARTWRTRASASSARSVARDTAGACPDASRTASLNESPSGEVRAGACAASATGAATSQASTTTERRLALRDAMEIQIDVGGEITLDVERLWHTGRERAPRHHRVHQRRHRELRGDGHIHGTELAVRDAALDHARHQAVPARHDFVIVETGQ